jgi:hypothetical protein
MTREDIDNIKAEMEREITEKEGMRRELKGYINGLLKGLAWVDKLIDSLESDS